MDPEAFQLRDMRMMPTHMPQVTRGTDVVEISEDEMPTGQNSGQSYQQRFVDPTFEMVLQRYENISPPDTNYQRENPCNEPIDLHKNSPHTVTGKSPQTASENIRTRSNKNTTTMQQNTEKFSYSQTNQYFETNHDRNDILPVENNGVYPRNASEMRPLFNLQTPPDPAFEISRWRDAEMPQPVLYPQLDLPRVAQFQEVAGNAQYIMPAEHINTIQEDVRELPQNFAQTTHQRFNQSFQLNQQRYSYVEMTPNMYPQVPPYFHQNMYNPRPVQPSRFEYRHHQMPAIRGSQPSNQYQQHRTKTFPRPNYVSGQSVNHKQQQNYYHSHNKTNNIRRPQSAQQSRVKQQRLLMQQQATNLQYYGQQNTNLNTTQQQNLNTTQQQNLNATQQQNSNTTQQHHWNQTQQRILHQIYKYQKLRDYYRVLYENAIRNEQINC